MNTKTIALAMMSVMATATAVAADQPRNVWVQDVFQEIQTRKPVTTRECVMVQSGGDAAGGALAGMIIGGLIGKGATGQDNGAAAGAVIGGIIGADRAANSGGSLREKCTDVVRYATATETVYSYSVIHFEYEGKDYEITFYK